MAQGSTSSSSQHIKISNSFNELVPYAYDSKENAQPQECAEAILAEDPKDKEDITHSEVEDVVDTTHVSHISSRQRKKEAKNLFSGSRPKSRHRA